MPARPITTATPIEAARSSRLSDCCSRPIEIEPAEITPCSFRKAITEPQEESEPMMQPNSMPTTIGAS